MNMRLHFISYFSDNQLLMMLKKQEPLEDTVITEPETPPLEPPTQSQSNSQLIHRIIASNEQLIHQQMMAMRELQRTNADLEDRLKQLSQKYETLLNVAFEDDRQPTSHKKQIEEQAKQKNQGEAGQIRKISVEKLLVKIAELQQQLSTTKVELAVKSAQLLTAAFQHSHDDSAQRRRKTLTPQSTKNDIQQYFQPLPLQREEQPLRKATPENKEALQGWTKLLEQYGTEQKASRFKQKSSILIKKSIPRQLRGKCWPLLIQNRLGMTNALYIQLLQRREKGWVCEKVRIQIDKDIKRSFYGKTNYETKTGFILEVVQFLQIFHVFRPDVSYVQGMTYPAMVLIPVLGKIKAFTLFSNLVLGNSFFRRLFAMQGNFVSTLCRAFQMLLQDTVPAVSQQLSSMGIQSQIYLIQWLFTFFSRGLSLESTLKFWDQLLYHEQVAIFRMGLSIFQQLAPALVGLSYEGTVGCVREYASNVKEERVVDGLVSSKLTSQKMYRVMEKVKL